MRFIFDCGNITVLNINEEFMMRSKTITALLASLALSLVAFAGMTNTEQFAQAAQAEAQGREALVQQVFGRPNPQLAQADQGA